MIAKNSDKGFGNISLLDDLIEYVYDGSDCKLILIGDTAQLPPVNLDISPALSESFLAENYSKEILSYCELSIETLEFLRNAAKTLKFSARSFNRIKKIYKKVWKWNL